MVDEMDKEAGDGVAVYALHGRLVISKAGWLVLEVPNDMIRGIFAAMHEPGIQLPFKEDGTLNAHISVMRPEEVEQLGGPDKITERGKQFSYQLGPIKTVNPAGWRDISKAWVIEVTSPELKNLRKSYGLTPLPHNDEYPFHITAAVRRTGVMHPNEITKTATVVKQSPLSRYGIFAEQDYTAEEPIGTGLVALPDSIEGPGITHYIRTELGRFINQSKTPNCHLAANGNHWDFVASRPIRTGEELTSDYLADNGRIMMAIGAYDFHYGGYLRGNVYVPEHHGGGGNAKRDGEPPIRTVAVDFDGTLADSDSDLTIKGIKPGAKEMLDQFVEAGWRIIIFTVRGDIEPVRRWLDQMELPYHTINYNPDQPENGSGKVLADVYLDDRAINAISLAGAFERALALVNMREQF